MFPKSSKTTPDPVTVSVPVCGAPVRLTVVSLFALLAVELAKSLAVTDPEFTLKMGFASFDPERRDVSVAVPEKVIAAIVEFSVTVRSAVGVVVPPSVKIVALMVPAPVIVAVVVVAARLGTVIPAAPVMLNVDPPLTDKVVLVPVVSELIE